MAGNRVALKNVLSYRSGRQKSKMVSRCQKPRCQQAVFLPRALGKTPVPCFTVPRGHLRSWPCGPSHAFKLSSAASSVLWLWSPPLPPSVADKAVLLAWQGHPRGRPPLLSQLLKATQHPLISHLNSTCNLRSPLPCNLA